MGKAARDLVSINIMLLQITKGHEGMRVQNGLSSKEKSCVRGEPFVAAFIEIDSKDEHLNSLAKDVLDRICRPDLLEVPPNRSRPVSLLRGIIASALQYPEAMPIFSEAYRQIDTPPSSAREHFLLC